MRNRVNVKKVNLISFVTMASIIALFGVGASAAAASPVNNLSHAVIASTATPQGAHTQAVINRPAMADGYYQDKNSRDFADPGGSGLRVADIGVVNNSSMIGAGAATRSNGAGDDSPS